MIDDKNLEKKKKFLEYFKDVPMQKFGAMHIGVDEDTIGNWKKEDSDFSDSIDNLKAAFVKDNLGDVKNLEWKLERMFKREFAQRTELTGAEGKDLPQPIIGNAILNNDSNPKDIPTKETN